VYELIRVITLQRLLRVVLIGSPLYYKNVFGIESGGHRRRVLWRGYVQKVVLMSCISISGRFKVNLCAP